MSVTSSLGKFFKGLSAHGTPVISAASGAHHRFHLRAGNLKFRIGMLCIYCRNDCHETAWQRCLILRLQAHAQRDGRNALKGQVKSQNHTEQPETVPRPLREKHAANDKRDEARHKNPTPACIGA